jgi:hypothetical protein
MYKEVPFAVWDDCYWLCTSLCHGHMALDENAVSAPCLGQESLFHLQVDKVLYVVAQKCVIKAP